MGRLIKGLAMLVVVAAGLWSGWWYLGAEGQRKAVEAWLDAQRARGWQAEAATIEVTGYPLNFAMHASDIALADPATGWSWQAPELHADSEAMTPTRIGVTWPAEHALAVPGDRAVITSTRMETLLDLRPGPAMALREASSTLAGLTVTGRKGWKAGAEAADLVLTERAADLGPPNSYDLRITGDAIALPKEWVAEIDPTGWLKPKVDRLTVMAHGTFDEALGRVTVEEGRLALRSATIREAGFQWGDMRLVITGSFVTDDDGFPEGRIDIEVAEWRQMLRLARRSGLIDKGTAESIQTGIELLTALTGGGDDLRAPLGFSGGKIRLGPFAIADAPRVAPPL